jgi:mono/diheme cytochrome c family protein
MRSFLVVLGFAALAATLQAADAGAGKAAYDKSCKGCHGPDGTPSAGMAKAMNLKDLKSPDVQAMSDDDLKKVITDGKGKMKPVASASGAAADVVAYIRTWKK